MRHKLWLIIYCTLRFLHSPHLPCFSSYQGSTDRQMGPIIGLWYGPRISNFSWSWSVLVWGFNFLRALVGPGLARIYFLEIDSYYVIVDFEWMTSLKARGHWIESREVNLFSISMWCIDYFEAWSDDFVIRWL